MLILPINMKTHPTLIEPSTFESLDTMGKRMALAEDVLQRVNIGNLVPSAEQTFFQVIGGDTNWAGKDRINQTPCEVCVKEAILCSFIGNFNKYDMGGLRSYEVEEYPPEILEIFNSAMLGAMEIAFEKETDLVGNDTDYDLSDSLMETFCQTTSHSRLTAIMKNIIANRGKIVCKDGTVVE